MAAEQPQFSLLLTRTHKRIHAQQGFLDCTGFKEPVVSKRETRS